MENYLEDYKLAKIKKKKMMIIQKQKKKTKVTDIVFVENYLEDYKLAKFRPNGFRSCRLEVKNVHVSLHVPVTLQNVCCKKKENIFCDNLPGIEL